MEWSFRNSDLESDAAKIQEKIHGEHTAAEADVKSTEAKVTSTKKDVTSTAATVTSTDTANKAKGHDAKTATAWTNAKKAATAAVTAHTDAVTDAHKAKAKYDELTKWVAFGEKTLTNNWNTTQDW